MKQDSRRSQRWDCQSNADCQSSGVAQRLLDDYQAEIITPPNYNRSGRSSLPNRSKQSKNFCAYPALNNRPSIGYK
jgi:hypothetical protein